MLFNYQLHRIYIFPVVMLPNIFLWVWNEHVIFVTPLISRISYFNYIQSIALLTRINNKDNSGSTPHTHRTDDVVVYIHKVLDSIRSTIQGHGGKHTCNFSTWEMEMRGSEVSARKQKRLCTLPPGSLVLTLMLLPGPSCL